MIKAISIISSILISSSSAMAQYTWSTEYGCKMTEEEKFEDSRPDVIIADQIYVKDWTNFKIERYEGECEVQIRYTEVREGTGFTGYGTGECWAEGEEVELGDLIVEQGNDKNIVMLFRNASYETLSLKFCDDVR